MLTNEEIQKIKEWDILYTTNDNYEDLDGYYDPPLNIGKISICVDEVKEYKFSNDVVPKLYIFAKGGYVYDPENLTTLKPEKYHSCGEGVLPQIL